MSAPFTQEDMAWAQEKWPEPKPKASELLKWHMAFKKAWPDLEPNYIKLEHPHLEEIEVAVEKDGESIKTNKIVSHGKDPLSQVSWKKNFVDIEAAMDHMVSGGNIGIVATKENQIVFQDEDAPEKITGSKDTLTVASRKRTGRHKTYVCTDPEGAGFTASVNKSVGDNKHEWASLRCNNSYVVGPGSFVYLTRGEYEAIPEDDRENAGHYTIIKNTAPASITYQELPEIFREAIESDKKRASEIKLQPKKYDGKTDGKRSAIFEMTPEDIYGSISGNFPTPPAFHDSTTGTNCKIDDGLLTCWRHGVTHNGYSCLAVEAGLAECEDGVPHHGSGDGLKHDGEEQFKIWEYAKKHGIIPLDDKIPFLAASYYAIEKGFISQDELKAHDGKLPSKVYRKVLRELGKEGLLPEYTESEDEKEQRTQVQALFGEDYAGIELPESYKIDATGTYVMKIEKVDGKLVKRKVKISSTPFTITGMGKNIDTGDMIARITHLSKDKNVLNEIIPVKDALCKASVTALIPKGILFTDESARAINDYNLACADGSAGLPKIAMVDNNGWKKTRSGDVFVCGNVGYWVDEQVDVLPSSNMHGRGLGPRGDLSEWIRGVGPALEKYDLLRFKIYTALAAPLLRILCISSFIQDHYGESGIGKSSSTEIAMSCWGDPEKLKFNGDTTKTAAEYSAAMMCDLPLFMDETGTQNKQEALSALVYMIANEQGRMRGKKDGGLREIASWKTIAMTTGEKPIVDSTGFTGQQVRVMPITSSLTPNGELSEDIANAVETIRTHNGHLGPLMIRKIFENGDRCKRLLKENEQRWRDGCSVTEHRMLRQYAAIYVAGVLFEEIAEGIGLKKKDPEEIVMRYMKEARATSRIEDYAIRGLRDIIDWKQIENRKFIDIPTRRRIRRMNQERAQKEYGNMYDPDMCEPAPIGQEIFGYDYPGMHIDIIPSALKTMLKGKGLSYDRIIDELKELGVVEADKDGRREKKVRKDPPDILVDRVIRISIPRAEKALSKGDGPVEEWMRAVTC